MENETGPSTLTTRVWTASASHVRQPLALVLSDDLFTDLNKLTTHRCKAALSFAGKYRVIDFALSNCVNSGVDTIGVITQYQPRSLHDHLAYGRPWDLDRRSGGLTLLHPYQARTGMGWYAGSADAIYQNQDFILRQKADQTFILSGTEIYTLDLDTLSAQHRKAKADLTIAAVTREDAHTEYHQQLAIDRDGRVLSVAPPGSASPGLLAMMGVMVFSTDVLNWRLSEDAERASSTHDLIRDVIPAMIQAGDRVMAFQYTGYWNGLQSVQEYWQANMDLLSYRSLLNLQDTSWPIHTKLETRPPTRVSIGARVSHSLLSEGCVVDGTVEYTVLSPGVYVAPGAVVRNAVVMHDVTIEERATIENAILDKEVSVGPQAHVGRIRRHAPTLSNHKPSELVVVEQGTHIAAHERVAPAESDSLNGDWALVAHRSENARP
jgi:glucose-1-phosphate adenylyltransferase